MSLHHPSQSTTSQLLALPSELRTMIYEFALVKPDRISLVHDSGILEPALLSINNQVRSEAMDIYYKRNNFEVLITDFNSSTLLKLHRKALSLKIQGIQNFSIKFRFIGQPNWLNLRKRVQRYFEYPGLLYVLPPSKTVIRQRTSMGDIIGTMFATASVMRKAGLKWSDVELILTEYREMLKNGDERWG